MSRFISRQNGLPRNSGFEKLRHYRQFRAELRSRGSEPEPELRKQHPAANGSGPHTFIGRDAIDILYQFLIHYPVSDFPKRSISKHLGGDPAVPHRCCRYCYNLFNRPSNVRQAAIGLSFPSAA
jgi:hypothetical protein